MNKLSLLVELSLKVQAATRLVSKRVLIVTLEIRISYLQHLSARFHPRLLPNCLLLSIFRQNPLNPSCWIVIHNQSPQCKLAVFNLRVSTQV